MVFRNKKPKEKPKDRNIIETPKRGFKFEILDDSEVDTSSKVQSVFNSKPIEIRDDAPRNLPPPKEIEIPAFVEEEIITNTERKSLKGRKTKPAQTKKVIQQEKKKEVEKKEEVPVTNTKSISKKLKNNSEEESDSEEVVEVKNVKKKETEKEQVKEENEKGKKRSQEGEKKKTEKDPKEQKKNVKKDQEIEEKLKEEKSKKKKSKETAPKEEKSKPKDEKKEEKTRQNIEKEEKKGKRNKKEEEEEKKEKKKKEKDEPKEEKKEETTQNKEKEEKRGKKRKNEEKEEEKLFHSKISCNLTDSERLLELVHVIMKNEVEEATKTNKEHIISSVKTIFEQFFTETPNIVFDQKTVPNEVNDYLKVKEKCIEITMEKLKKEEKEWIAIENYLKENSFEPIEFEEINEGLHESEYSILNEMNQFQPNQFDKIDMCTSEISLLQRKGEEYLKKKRKILSQDLNQDNPQFLIEDLLN